jgi:O-acetyl-ADP-ribose deacetylase (regulator of RNase III)
MGKGANGCMYCEGECNKYCLHEDARNEPIHPAYREVIGNLITMAQQGKFQVITHGCNCFSTMGAGIAPQMAKAFGCDKFPLEIGMGKRGDYNKLGQIDWKVNTYTGGTDEFNFFEFDLAVVNSYTQYGFGLNHEGGSARPLDYDALRLCMRKINHQFKGRHVGLPKIGAKLAGGDWEIIKVIIQEELKDCKVTVVIYDKE